MRQNHKQILLLILGLVVLIVGIKVSGVFDKKSIVQAEEDFVILPGSKLKADILWVIDNSGSMRDNQQNLANNMDRFIESFLDRPEEEILDFRMAMITTDPENGGEILEDRIFDRRQALEDRTEFTSTFSSMVRVGAYQYTEFHFDPVIKAFEDDQKNRRFFRKEAISVVIFLTDQRDAKLPNQAYEPVVRKKIDAIRSFKFLGDSLGHQKVLIHSIIGPDCIHQRYASELTHGKIEDIDGDFSAGLKEIGSHIHQVVQSFRLSRKVSEGGVIQIWDDQDNELTGFEFNEGQNAVEFSKSPPAGTRITVVYDFDNLFEDEIY